MKLLKSKTTKTILILFRKDKKCGIGMAIGGEFSTDWNLNNFKEIYENSKKRKV